MGLVSRKELGADVSGKSQALVLGQDLETIIFGCGDLKANPSQGVKDTTPFHAIKLPANPTKLANDLAPFSPLLERRLAATG